MKKNRKKKSWCSDAPEHEAISLFAGLFANPDVPLSPLQTDYLKIKILDPPNLYPLIALVRNAIYFKSISLS